MHVTLVSSQEDDHHAQLVTNPVQLTLRSWCSASCCLMYWVLPIVQDYSMIFIIAAVI